jgi:uncharacterized protein (DUF2141 family)
MKTTIKLMSAAAMMIAISVFLYGCKAPVLPIQTSTNIAIDTADSIRPDNIAVVPAHDTVAARTPLTLIITNLASLTAPVIVGVYGTQNKFPDPNDQLRVFTFKPHGKSLTAQISSLKFNTYALAIYQDVNSNGKIDKNLIGIPTEPYAFSNNYKPKVKAPSFKNCQFDYDSINNTVTMNMIR